MDSAVVPKGFPLSWHFLWLPTQQPCHLLIDPGVRGSGPSNSTILLCEIGRSKRKGTMDRVNPAFYDLFQPLTSFC